MFVCMGLVYIWYPPSPCPMNNFVLKKYGPNGSVRWTCHSVRATILRNGGNTSLGTKHPAHSKYKAMEASIQRFSVEALVAVPLHPEKLNMLPGLGALLVLGTGRSGSLISLKDLWERHRLYSTS